MPPVGYVAYIDEAGDDGLHGPLRPDNPQGPSEWMAISAIVVSIENDNKCIQWMRQIIKKLDQPQLAYLHFRKLSEEKKELVCNEMAKLPIRCFVVISNKNNMQNYRNIYAERAKVNKTAWFYCWMSRLLLERVTNYCEHRSKNIEGEAKTVRIEFSDRGGVNIDDIKTYYKYLSEQSRTGLLYHDRFDLAWPVVDIENMGKYPNRMRAGLQFSDVISSAFFQAVERTPDGKVRPEAAKLLKPRMCMRPKVRGGYWSYGVKVLPNWTLWRLPSNQREILSFYAA